MGVVYFGAIIKPRNTKSNWIIRIYCRNQAFMFRVGFIRLDLSRVFRVLITSLEIVSIECDSLICNGGHDIQ